MESSLAAARLLNFTMQGPLLDQVLHQPALYKDRHYSTMPSQALLQKDQRNLTLLLP